MNGSAATRLSRWLPGFGLVRGYDRTAFLADLPAGVVIAALAVPQALGYAALAGVPVQVGLYAIPLALVAYALLGSSRQLVVGPVSTVSVLSGSLIAGMGAVPGSARAVALTCGLAVASGLILAVAGLLRLGWSAEFLSRPIVTGFVFGLVIVIVIGEVPKLLGISSLSGTSVDRLVAIVRNLGETNPTTAAVGAVSLLVLFGAGRVAPRVPWGLLVLLAGIALSQVLDLTASSVAVVGQVPRGLPPVGLPDLGLADVMPVATGGLALAMVGLAEGLSAARLFAVKNDYRIDTDQELVASGAANVGAGLLGGMGVAGSLSKTAASERAGGRTQVTGLVTATVVLLVVVLLAPRLSPLPVAVLSAIVVNAVWSLMDVPAMRRYAQIRRNDFYSAALALVGVVLFGPLYGLLLAIAQSVLGLIYRSSRVHLEVMGKVPDEKAAWGGVRHHPERHSVGSILVLRLDNPLFWVNSAVVHDQVLAAVAANPETRVVILDLEATPQLDTTSADALETMLRALRDAGVDLYLVRVLRRSRTVLTRSGFLDLLGDGHVWHSISQGVREAKSAIKADRKAASLVEADVGDSDVEPALDDVDESERIVRGNGDVDESEDEPAGPRLWWRRREH